jgi:signal recognition particle GTPase
MNEPYETLGVNKNATAEEIKQAYRDKSKEQHPDKGGDEEKFKETSQAYAIIGDPKKREQYDRTGSTETDDPLANIHAEVSKMFFQVIEHNKKGIKYLDIIKEMLDIITNANSRARQALIEKDVDIAYTTVLLERITSKNDSENFFEGIIKGRIKQFEHDKLMVEQQIEKHELMMEIIAGYECSVEERPEQPSREFFNHKRPTRWRIEE